MQTQSSFSEGGEYIKILVFNLGDLCLSTVMDTSPCTISCAGNPVNSNLTMSLG